MTSQKHEARGDDITGDLIVGIPAISAFLGQPTRKTYHLATNGQIPGLFKLGESWAGLKSEITAGLRERARSGIKTGGAA